MNSSGETPTPKLPLLIEANTSQDLASFCNVHSEEIESGLTELGAVLFRGFKVDTADDFDQFANSVSTQRMDYVYGSTPRKAVGNKIFTATEYPPSQQIPLHSEVSYHTEWPKKIALCCLHPAETGGATPVADLRDVTALIGEELVSEFSKRRVRYVRHYHPNLDVPWQDVFRTDDKKEVAKFCDANAIEYEWLENDLLRTSQVCQGTHTHPGSGETFFFNQSHLFHISSIAEDKIEALKTLFGETMLPRNAYWGDGEDIPSEVIEKIADAYASSAIDLNWQAGDVALLDNFRVAHGRRSYSGERRVLAALMDPVVGEKFRQQPARSKPWWKVW